MQFSPSVFTIAALSIGSAFAQTDTSSGINVHVVAVGGNNGSLTFRPNNLVAAVGEMVQFQFGPKNHSVVQSTFANPCTPISSVSSTVGIFSGYMPVAADATDIPTYTIMINSTKPIWLYCSQAKHCQAGMSMVINVNTASNSTLDAYQAAAALVTASSSPSSNTVSNGTDGSIASNSSSSSNSSSGSGSGASSSGTSTATTAKPTGAAPTLRVGSALGLVGAVAALLALL